MRRSIGLLVLGAIGGAVVVVLALLVWTAAGSAKNDRATPTVTPPDDRGVAGFVFQDRNGDGKKSADEPVLSGWRVRLFATGPLALTETTTASDGTFAFPKVQNIRPEDTSVALTVAPVLEGPAASSDDGGALSFRRTVKLGATIALAAPSYRLCLNVDECPGIRPPDLLPSLTSLNTPQYPPPTETVVDTTTTPGKTLLRFASSNINQGGLLDVVAADADSGALTQVVKQRIFGDGVVFIRDAGEFVFHPEHRHFHVGDFERYELLDSAGKVLATSGKVSFCLTDIQPIALDGKTATTARPEGELYLDLPPLECGTREQGINTGWADYYGRDLPDQWIDVTGLPSGRYAVRFIVNPDRMLFESDYTNNSVSFPIDYVAP